MPTLRTRSTLGSTDAAETHPKKRRNTPTEHINTHRPNPTPPQSLTMPARTYKPLSSMEIEQQQAPVIQKFVQQASTLRSDHGPSSASALVSLIVEATSHPSLFAFSEILALPNLLQLQGTENSSYLDLLRLFAYGTWHCYKSNAGNLPQLRSGQVIKLKQLTVLTLAETNKVLSYDKLLQELEISNVRELEDFLIDHCIYAGIVKGKLNQLQRCLQVQFAAGRDLMDEQIGSMIETLSNWLNTSESLIPSIEEKVDWASKMFKLEKEHRKEINDEILKAARTAELMNADFWVGPPGPGFFGHGPYDHDVSDHDPHMINLFGQEFHYNEAGFDSLYKRGRSPRELRQRWGNW